MGRLRRGPSVAPETGIDLKNTGGGPEKNSAGRSAGQSRSACRSHSTKVAHSQRSIAPGRQHRK
jgi:hypothetical protein